MSKLVEDVAKQYEAFRTGIFCCGGEYKPEYDLEWARDVLRLIESHPETLERRRKDFEAGRRHQVNLVSTGGFGTVENLSSYTAYTFKTADEYLAAEKEKLK